MFRKWMTALVAVAMLALCASAGAVGDLGAPMEDFSVDTIDGGTFTLSRALEQYDMVLINLWASWCGPCEMEFPYLQEVYERYSDRAAVIALSIERSDTPEALTAYAEAHGLTFAIGSDSETRLADQFADKFGITTIPTTVVVDRFGNMALVETGAQISAAAFEGLFRYFLDDGYTETAVLDTFPDPVSTTDHVTEEALSAAASAEGAGMAFRNPDDEHIWPMLPDEVDGRTALVSSNAMIPDTACAVYADVTAAVGDALAFAFKTSAQVGLDGLYVAVDGEVVKRFTGMHDWTEWAIPLAEGVHEVAFGYQKAPYDNADGEDRAWIDDVRVASGSEAEALLGAMPVYPVADAFAMTVDGAARVALDDPTGVIGENFNSPEAWICGDEAVVHVDLPEGIDPDAAFLSTIAGGWTRMADFIDADGAGYSVTVPVGDTYTLLYIYPGGDESSLDTPWSAILFNGESGADAFVTYIKGYGFDAGWSYGG